MVLKKLRVGVIGGGDVAQVVHLPILQLLSHLYITQAICDVSKKTADHCSSKFSIPMSTTNPDDVFRSPDIEVVLILTSDEFHAPYVIAALRAGKTVMVEKPITLSLRSCEAVLEVERCAPNGARFFVGYMRRYAPSLEAFKREISTIKSIKYARVRDIFGPNSYFLCQSGTTPTKFFDDIPAAAGEERQQRLSNLLEESWGVPYSDLSPLQLDYCCLLANLGSHGLSLMREVLGGLPEEVLASTDNARWYTAMFDYRNRSAPHERFTCLFETGIDSVPRFDSHVVVYGENKSVSICYDTPFIKGLGIKVEIDEINKHGEQVHRTVQTSYEDAYTAELKEFHACVVNKKPIKTTAADAMEDLKLFNMIMAKYPEYNKKQGTAASGVFLPSGP